MNRWQHLVAPAWLARLLAGEPVAAAPSADWRLFEVGQGDLEGFGEAHIPHAGYPDTDRLECEPWWNKVWARAGAAPDQRLRRRLVRVEPRRRRPRALIRAERRNVARPASRGFTRCLY